MRMNMHMLLAKLNDDYDDGYDDDDDDKEFLLHTLKNYDTGFLALFLSNYTLRFED